MMPVRKVSFFLKFFIRQPPVDFDISTELAKVTLDMRFSFQGIFIIGFSKLKDGRIFGVCIWTKANVSDQTAANYWKGHRRRLARILHLPIQELIYNLTQGK